ncbi:MAG: ATP-binding protein [Patescibacteria group bacterium]|nr:ATP-binding protein [Patescibacteria group bacterium]
MRKNLVRLKNYLLSSRAEDGQQAQARKLQVIALISVSIMFSLNIIRFYDYIIDPNNQGLPLHVTFIILLLFIGIWNLSKNGRVKSSAWLLISAYSLPTIFCFYTWGTDLPAAILLTVLIVMLAGLFLGSRAAIIITAFYSILMLVLSYLQTVLILPISSNWRLEAPQFADTITYVLLCNIIFLLAWIIVRENHQALIALANSRNELQQERDQLEITVTQRTKEIINIKKEKLEQLQSLASIGQLSGGIFHDIVNPLTVVGLNLEQIKTETSSIKALQDNLKQAISATKRIKGLIDTNNNHLRRCHKNQLFSIKKEIQEIISIMTSKANAQNVTISLLGDDYNLNGDKSRFGQVIMNLLSNSIEACYKNENQDKKILIQTEWNKIENSLEIKISDNGVGMSAEQQEHIFQPFFSTKENNGKNIGLGLSIVKEIIKEDFTGDISVHSRQNFGAQFIITLPICQSSEI